jgi:hypothetical protein
MGTNRQDVVRSRDIKSENYLFFQKTPFFCLLNVKQTKIRVGIAWDQQCAPPARQFEGILFFESENEQDSEIESAARLIEKYGDAADAAHFGSSSGESKFFGDRNDKSIVCDNARWREMIAQPDRTAITTSSSM